ncbi:MAG: ribosome biogenesis GTPase Der, partial [Acidimicrobiia bacterium]
NRESDVWDFTRLGLGQPLAISALHGRRSGELLDAIVDALPEPPEEAGGEADGAGEVAAGNEEAAPFSVAIVGRPNVGKSTLFNRLVGEERAVVHDAPGTTRDTIDTVVDTGEGRLRFIDTAGMRRKSRIDEGTEYYGLVRALQAIDHADGALMVIDATHGVTHQDQRLAERIDAAGCATVIVLNKWDLLDADAREDALAQVADRLAFLAYAPVLKTSALTGRNVTRLLPALFQAQAEYHRRVPTRALNEVLAKAQAAHPAPQDKGHRPRVLYATQGATDPPTFTLFTTRALPASYLRYLERKIREGFSFGPTPIKLRVRRRGG